jgi:AdoMet-dependent heme synthase
MIAMSETRREGQEKTWRGDVAVSPLIVFYEITQACDLVCQHCRACSQPIADPAELNTGESLGLMDQLSEFPSPPILVLTGGDPLKRGDIFQVIEHAVRVGLDVSITPSATPLVTRQAIYRLRDAGVSRMAISIDGADAATHDALRGVPGSFQRSLEILADARDAGLPTQINTTLTPLNVAQIDRMAGRFADLDIGMWSLFFLVPVGRARHLPRLTADECEAAFARLWRQSQRQPYRIKTTEAPHYRRFAIQHQRADIDDRPIPYISRGVNDGKGVMFIGHTGLVHPSGFLPIVCGIYPLSHVVRVYQDSPIFRALRDANRLEGKCRVCEFRHVCGGSRARAYAVTGNLFAQEPDCNYRPAM